MLPGRSGQILRETGMGYFDFLTSSYFKTGQDGRKQFFPWGILGDGYTIASEQDYLRLQQQIKIYMIVSLVLVIGTASLKGDLVGLLIATLLIGVYSVWTRFLLHRLQRSGERLSLRESSTSRARLLGPVALWLLEIVALAFVGGAVFILIVDPGKWFVALVGIVLFGLVAAKVAYMLILQRRATATGTAAD
jgi:hypothetical protein